MCIRDRVHTEKVKTVLAVQNFFKKRVTPSVQQQQPNQQPMQDVQEPASPSNSESTTPNSSTSNAQQQTMDYLIVSNRTLKAEINFLVFSITKGHSWNSFVGLNQILQDIFPDSQIVQNFQLSSDKARYLTNFGLAPYVREVVLAIVTKSPQIVVSFDESLNVKTQSCQMDLQLRYFDVEDDLVKVRYIDSKFIGQSSNVDLLKAFLSGLEKLDHSTISQISMDGPNVNWLFYEKYVEHRKEVLGEIFHFYI